MKVQIVGNTDEEFTRWDSDDGERVVVHSNPRTNPQVTKKESFICCKADGMMVMELDTLTDALFWLNKR